MATSTAPTSSSTTNTPASGGGDADTRRQDGGAAAANRIPQSTTTKKICMKRNYKTVIKKYPLRSSVRTNKKPYQTVQIEINETIEIPDEAETSHVLRKSVKRKWNTLVESDIDEGKEGDEEEVSPTTRLTRGGRRGQATTSRFGNGSKSGPAEASYETETDNSSAVSKKIVKFSDDNSDITVSIVNNNNVCPFGSNKPRVHKYRHKTLLQVDGAANVSSCSESSDSDLATTTDTDHSVSYQYSTASALVCPSVASTSHIATSSSIPSPQHKIFIAPSVSSVVPPTAQLTPPISHLAPPTSHLAPPTPCLAPPTPCLAPPSHEEGGACTQSSLALRIKEQSLAHSTPGDEGPYKCVKCRRLYR